jgi:hypothetical protein
MKTNARIENKDNNGDEDEVEDEDLTTSIAYQFLIGEKITYHQFLANSFKSVSAAVFLGRLLNCWKETTTGSLNGRSNWLKDTKRVVLKETGLSEEELELALQIFIPNGVVYEGCDTKDPERKEVYYRVDFDHFIDALRESKSQI